MKILKHIYELYLRSIENMEDKNFIMETTENDLKIFRNIQDTLNKKPILIDKKNAVCEGDIFIFNNLYFVISDKETYPYEVLIVSPFWELGTHKDIVVNGEENRWVIESIARYVTDEIIEKSLHIDRVDKKYIEIMKSYLNDETPLPENLTGTEYKDDENSFYELFRKSEIKRSLILTVSSIEELDDEIDEKIEIDIRNIEAENRAVKEFETKLAAASFERFITTQFGEIIKKDDGIDINFKEDFAGCLAEISINNSTVFDGYLPKKLKIHTNIKYPEQLKEIMNIELL